MTAVTDREIERLTAGARPARPEDNEVARLAAGEPPAPATAEGEFIATLSASYAAQTVASKWGKNPLAGPRKIKLGDSEFSIPQDAEVKHSRRASTYWVRVNGLTYIFSASGCLEQSDAERRASEWDLL